MRVSYNKDVIFMCLSSKRPDQPIGTRTQVLTFIYYDAIISSRIILVLQNNPAFIRGILWISNFTIITDMHILFKNTPDFRSLNPVKPKPPSDSGCFQILLFCICFLRLHNLNPLINIKIFRVIKSATCHSYSVIPNLFCLIAEANFIFISLFF